MLLPATVVVGQPICPVKSTSVDGEVEYTAGSGCVVTEVPASVGRVRAVVATVVGTVAVHDQVVLVVPRKATGGTLPVEGSVVLVRITRLSLREARCELLAMEQGPIGNDGGAGANGAGPVAVAGGASLNLLVEAVASLAPLTAIAPDIGEPYRGIIRSQDIRATHKDTAKVVELFRPGDVVRCVVVLLGDGSNYYLSTAGNELGVVFARSVKGNEMYAADWETMVDGVTGVGEKRKVAKPVVARG